MSSGMSDFNIVVDIGNELETSRTELRRGQDKYDSEGSRLASRRLEGWRHTANILLSGLYWPTELLNVSTDTCNTLVTRSQIVTLYIIVK